MGKDSFFGGNLLGQDPWARRGELDARVAANTIPVGVINAYYGTIAPSGWLLCDGAAIPAQYPALIALIGANTPNLKGRVLVGIDAAQTEFDVLGETGGSKTSTAPHTHDLANHNHGNTGSTDAGSGKDVMRYVGSGGDRDMPFGAPFKGATDLSHVHSTGSPSSNTSGASSAAATSGNLQPYVAVQYIIRAA